MAYGLIRPFRFLVQALTAENTPRQLAWGLAIGVAIGLVPKGNLIGNAFLNVGNNRANVSPSGVAAGDNLPLNVLAADHIGAAVAMNPGQCP